MLFILVKTVTSLLIDRRDHATEKSQRIREQHQPWTPKENQGPNRG